MKHNVNEIWKMIIILGIVFFIVGCSLSSNPSVKPTPTSTVTSGGSGPPLPGSNRCDGLSGEFEMKVLVGPSEAVGLEPFGVGSIPFSVVSDGGANVVQGGGSISYQDLLEEEWGTFTVEFDLAAEISGDCLGDEQSGELKIAIVMSGEQMVEVRAEGFQGDYPWTGSTEFNLSFPIEEGSTAEGEGWAFVLHLNE